MRLLVVIDSVNFNGGAHTATWAMIDALKERGVTVDILTCSEPTADRVERLANTRCHVMQDAFPRRGVRFFVQGVCRRLKLGWVPNWTIDPLGRARCLMRMFDTVLVIGENSHLRDLVGSVTGPRKVVFIHTDYVAWRNLDPWASVDSRCDERVYRRFDCIAVVGWSNAERFKLFFPQFADKVVAFYNLMPKKSQMKHCLPKKFTISSFGRLNWGPPKSTELAIRIAANLKSKGFDFIWRWFGNGTEVEVDRLRRLVAELDVADVFVMPGFCLDVQKEMAHSTITAHLSAYEGVSNTIYESLILGVPVVATDVGGAHDQIEDGRTGCVLPFDVNVISEAMANLFYHPQTVTAWRENLEGYSYDNAAVVKEYMHILNFAA